MKDLIKRLREPMDMDIRKADEYYDEQRAEAASELENRGVEVNEWKSFVGKLANLVPVSEVIKATGTLGDFADWINNKIKRADALERMTWNTDMEAAPKDGRILLSNNIIMHISEWDAEFSNWWADALEGPFTPTKWMHIPE